MYISYFFEIFYHFSNFTIFLQVKKMEESLVEVEKENSPTEEKYSHRVITIDSSEGSKTQKVILEKPTLKMTRHIRPLYLRAHFNGKPVSKVLVDNGSTVNVMPLRMLRALGRGIGDLIETEVSISAFTREISKTLGVLPIVSLWVVYYLSRVLNPVETRYTLIENLCLALYFACTKLRHYLIKSRVYVVSHIELVKYMLNQPLIIRRIGKWSLTLSEFTLIDFPYKSVKGQALADFLANHPSLEIGIEQSVEL